MSNTELWDKLCRVPAEHLKSFSRAGGFKGTAIKPMWSFHKMTEQFGSVGLGWGVNQPSFQVVPAGDEILVYCTVSVWHGNAANTVFGVGGDKVRVVQSSGPRNDDEAFKKAYTDALTNALKLLGVGADVHMGLWDGNKYVDEKPEAPAPAPRLGLTGGTPGASKAANREPFDRMIKEIRNCATVKALTEWKISNAAEIDELPNDFFDSLSIEYSDRKGELKKALAA